MRNSGRKEIQKQIQAAEDIGANAWMLWSPSSKYHKDYLYVDK